MELRRGGSIYIPDGAEEKRGMERTTHLAICAHQDDMETMAYSSICECFESREKWFSGIVLTDGAGSPRAGKYASVTDAEMVKIRQCEQRKAAAIGEYGFAAMLNYPSSEIKKIPDCAIKEISEILIASKPRYIYTHNLADKHDTHVAAAVCAIKAVRSLSDKYRPEKIYGLEGWRNLDWMCDDEKVCMDCSAHPNLEAALLGVFDSQIEGGKRYDLASQGRRVANATFSESHSCDKFRALSFSMDLTPLIDGRDMTEYITDYINRFKEDVARRIKKYTGE